ncbi:hypothetical protein M3D00_13100 [Dietzia cinnamea]|uniref:hypothetical protein n=1 Tax=Dietzia cinnamea TaxID=321318 RepID=UPI0021A4E212|nr:hypothetical protein [Dietzia cinnamea]MCT2031079.1 hypothetical protein [Dietzia cinnamea]
MLTDVVTVLAQDPAVVLPPTSPVGPPPEAMTRFTQAVGWVKWGATAVMVAGVMAIGALLTVDNRLIDQYGPSIQAIAIKVVLGCLVVATAGHFADVFI